jgi:hypothetical protein
MLPELRARAFVITGVEAANVAQTVRDRIAELPAGGDWDKLKKEIVNDISPCLGSDNDEEGIAAAERRAVGTTRPVRGAGGRGRRREAS